MLHTLYLSHFLIKFLKGGESFMTWGFKHDHHMIIYTSLLLTIRSRKNYDKLVGLTLGLFVG